MTTIATKTLALIAALAATIALTGCTTTGFESHPSAPTASSTPTFDPADTDQDGTVTGFEQEQHDRKQPRDYTLADGTAVTISPSEPLPDNVKADIAVKAPVATDGRTDPFTDYLDQVYDATGVKVILIFDYKNRGHWVAVAYGHDEGVIDAKPTVDEAITAANTWNSASQYQIIVAS